MIIAILGAGISGLSCASILRQKGFDLRIFEKEKHVGGLCRSKVTNGYVFDLHGGHVFNSKYDDVREWVFSKLDSDKWHYSVRNAKILYNGRLISYPFELALAELDVREAIECLVDFVKPKGHEPDNFRDWLIWNFGQAICERYMIPYNNKIWAFPLHEMCVDWIKGKMPLPTIREVVTALLTKDPKERKMPHSTFYYPLQGGIQSLINAIINEVSEIKTDFQLNSLECIGKKWVINGEDYFDHVICTIPLKELTRVLKLPEKVKRAIEDLKYNSLTTTICESSKNDNISWIYVPSKEYRAHRLVFQGNFAPGNCPEGKSSITIETIGKIDPDNQVNEFKRCDQPKEIQLEDIIDTSFTEYAYMIFDKNYPENINLINSYFKDINFTLLGRFAEWKYYNMDVCIKRAFEVADELNRRVGD